MGAMDDSMSTVQGVDGRTWLAVTPAEHWEYGPLGPARTIDRRQYVLRRTAALPEHLVDPFTCVGLLAALCRREAESGD
jgi:hypothetical protein